MNKLVSLGSAYHIWELMSACKLAHVFPMLNLPTPILYILKPSFQTPQRTLSDGFTSPSHLDILAYVPSLPQNALIKVTKSLLIIKSKEKILFLSYWNSLLHLTVLITFSLKLFTTLVSMATHSPSCLLHLSGPCFFFSFVACPHLDWFLKCHCNSWFWSGVCPSLSLVISLILRVPITLWKAMVLGQYFQSNFFLSSRPKCLLGSTWLWPWPLGCESIILLLRLAPHAVFPIPGVSPPSTPPSFQVTLVLTLSLTLMANLIHQLLLVFIHTSFWPSSPHLHWSSLGLSLSCLDMVLPASGLVTSHNGCLGVWAF